MPLGLTAGEVARAIDVPRTRIERIVSEQTGISADTAIWLGRLFGTSPQFWMNAQVGFNLDMAQAAIGKAASTTASRCILEGFPAESCSRHLSRAAR